MKAEGCCHTTTEACTLHITLKPTQPVLTSIIQPSLNISIFETTRYLSAETLSETQNGSYRYTRGVVASAGCWSLVASESRPLDGWRESARAYTGVFGVGGRVRRGGVVAWRVRVLCCSSSASFVRRSSSRVSAWRAAGCDTWLV